MNWKSDLIRSRAGRFFLERAAKFYDQFVCTAGTVRRQARKPRKVGTRLRFSVGIPHYNRGRLIYRPLFNLLNHPAVDEVVIVDDGSRVEALIALGAGFNPILTGRSPRWSLARRLRLPIDDSVLRLTKSRSSAKIEFMAGCGCQNKCPLAIR